MVMPQSVQYLHTLALLLFALSILKGVSASQHNHDQGLKSLHFTLYQHDTLNKTSYIIVTGVTGPGISPTTSPFGTLAAFQDNLTMTPDPSSEAVGIAEGATVTSRLDGLWNTGVQKYTLSNLKNHKGSITTAGSAHNIKPSDIPVVGGTGDFLLVQGYVTITLFDLKGFTSVYKAEFHLYWPPHANKLS